MKKIMILSTLFILAGCLFMNGSNKEPATKVSAEETSVLWEEDFESDKPEYASIFEVDSGVAYPRGPESLLTHNFTAGEMVESNNYRVSFDLQLLHTKTETFFYIHFLGATSSGSSIFLSIERNGQWSCIVGLEGGSITTGEGTPTDYGDGSYIAESIDFLGKYVHIEVVHFNTVFELYANGRRMISQSLMNIGNNVWDRRVSYNEGTITGLLFHWNGMSQSERTFAFDNVKVVEEKENPNLGYEQTVDAEQSVSKVFHDEITANTLAVPSFIAEATFTPIGSISEPERVNLEFVGLNGLLGLPGSLDKISVRFGLEISTTGVTPYIEYYDNGLKEHTFNLISEDITKPITIKVAISGQQAVLYVNDKTIETLDFTQDIYIYKGVAQCVALNNSANFVWTKIKLSIEFDVIEEVFVTASASVVNVGETVLFSATYKPSNVQPKSIIWSVNGTKIDAEGLGISLTMDAPGLMKIRCEIDGIRSENCYVNVVTPTSDTSSEQGGGSQTPSSNGCGGSIVAGSLLFSVSALIGALLLIRKKHDK